jgi:hypothetical protein
METDATARANLAFSAVGRIHHLPSVPDLCETGLSEGHPA